MTQIVTESNISWKFKHVKITRSTVYYNKSPFDVGSLSMMMGRHVTNQSWQGYKNTLAARNWNMMTLVRLF